MRFLLASTLAAVLLPLAAVACTANDSSENDNDTSEAQVTAGGGEGSVCDAQQKCRTGLVCKGTSTAPPPGAVGLPLPSSGTHTQGLPGFVLAARTCQKPLPGEQGASCLADSDCNDGLRCDRSSGSSSSGGAPPGAVGLPLPSSTSQPQGRPVLGLPILPAGTCGSNAGTSSSGGPPPGALGLPILP